MTPNIALRSPGRRQGAALIITLFFIVIITTLAVAYMTSSRMERSAANSHFERARANALARSAVDQVIATLQRETADKNRNWISQPGMLTVANGTHAVKTRLNETVYLSTGAPSVDKPSDPTFEPANLNVQTLQDQGRKTYLLLDPQGQTQSNNPVPDAPIDMKLRWVYVRKNGQWDLEGNTGDDPSNQKPIGPENLPIEKPDLTKKDNPIVGRFAYWADDESSKLNANLAWTRRDMNKNLPGHQTKIDLRALPDFETRLSNGWLIGDAVHNAVTDESNEATSNYKSIRRFFNSPLDVRRMAHPTLLSELGLQPSDGDLLRPALDRNKFNITHYNHDPDTTYYGKSRMVLTTQLENAVIRDSNGEVIMVDGKPLHRPFLDILKRSPSDLKYIDPGYANPDVIDVDKLNLVMQDLVDNYLKKDDWPMVDRAGNDKPSIQLKYYRNYSTAARDQRLAQIALNIIDYVRSAESEKPVVEPIRGRYLGNVFTPDFHPDHRGEIQGKDDTFKGLVRGPYMTEVGMWVANTAEATGVNKGRFRTLAFIEIYLPNDYGIEELNLTEPLEGGVKKTWNVYVAEFQRTYKERPEDKVDPKEPDKTMPLYYHFTGNPANNEPPIRPRSTYGTLDSGATQGAAFVWEAVTDPKKNVMTPGEYRTIVVEAFRDMRDKPVGPDRSKRPDDKLISLRQAITLSGGVFTARIDVSPLSNDNDQMKIQYPIDVPGTHPTLITSYETVDPRVNGLAKDWQKNGPKIKNTLFDTKLNTPGVQPRENYHWTNGISSGPLRGGGVGQNPMNVLPEQDRDKTGKVSSASLRMPYPKGHRLNPTGRVRSPGELGLIHTGIEGSNAAQQPGVPWRTLHLQPSTQGTSVVPDWAFMDLFTVPADVPHRAALLFAPHSSSTGGRVNMNAKPQPFEEIDRIHPLAAVLYGCRKSTLTNDTISLDEAIQIARNIYNRVPAKKTSLPAGKQYPASSVQQVYDSPGEVVEMLGIADGGEESEELVREIANLITSRGNVFSIYTVAQALKQTPDGRLLVTAEQRQHALVERYLIDKNTPDPIDDDIGFRSVYFRNLTP